jgi:hypothetical protein
MANHFLIVLQAGNTAASTHVNETYTRTVKRTTEDSEDKKKSDNKTLLT